MQNIQGMWKVEYLVRYQGCKKKCLCGDCLVYRDAFYGINNFYVGVAVEDFKVKLIFS